MLPTSTVNTSALSATSTTADAVRMSRVIKTLAIVCVLGFFVPFSILLIGLHFTDQPAETSFSLFQHSGATILIAYYALALDGIALMLFMLLIAQRYRQATHTAVLLATVSGIVGGLMQTVGYLRWPFLLSILANAYNDPHASPSMRSSTALIFQAVDQLAGVMMAEHLFYIFVGVWSLALGWYVMRIAQMAWLVAWLGIVSGGLFLLSSVEQFDVPALSGILLLVVVVSRIVWGAWMVSLAWHLFPLNARAGAVRPAH